MNQGLTEMYQGELLCDVTLVADGQRFPCHRFLVAHLSIQNCFEMYSLAQVHHSQPLLRAVLQLLVRNFELMFEEDHFLQLDFGDLAAILSSDDLEVASEIKVYQAIRRWVQGEPSKRRPFFGQLLRHIRFPLLGPDEQDVLQEDLERWDDLELNREVMDGLERLRQSRGLRQGMYKPHILCIDTQMCEYQQLESEEAHVSCYEPLGETWEKLPGLQSLTHACCTSNGDKVYLSGGVYKNAYSNSVYEFDAFTNQWLQLPPMGVPRAAHGFVFDRQKLYAMGGWRRFQSFINMAESLDLNAGTWTPIAKLPFALSHPASSVLREKVYLLGGATGISNRWLFHKGILIYEMASDTWTQVPLATGFFAAGAVAGENGIYVVGGYTEKKNEDWQERVLVPENRHSTRKCFFVNESGKANLNVAVPKLRRGLANAAVVRCGKRIYVLGGEDLSQRYKVIYHWQPGESRWHRAGAEIPVPREGISRFGCATLLRPKPHILQLFQVTSLVIVSGVVKS
ncbi:kelch-like protein 6 isoform X2 [Erythrolamprus reginae]|uniref:kelch-like protein 6 isoform X2 n=1 Tax=Erythrolamprus reginae TaxID=121349 RepID=UPI00396C97F2